MDSQRTPRAPEDPGRGSPMVKQNPPLGFRGPPPLSPRYPINNGSSGGPRGQQILHRAEGRSGGPFVQPRPPFGGSPQGNQRPGNPTIPQGVPRYPPGVRPPPPSNFIVGPRPQVLNQPQQIYYQPRNDETRPAGLEHSTPQIRFPPFPQNPETRQRNIPETVVTSGRNDRPLRAEGRVNGQSGVPIVRAHQATIRQEAEKMEEKMATISQRGTNIEDNVKPSPRTEDDDDDVVMDKENNSKSPDPKERPPSVRVPDSPGSRTSSYKSTPEHATSLVREDPQIQMSSAKKSPSPEPIVKSAKFNDREIGSSEIKSTPTMEDRLVSEMKSSPTPTMEELPVSEIKSSPTPTMEELPVSEIKSSPTPTMKELPVSEIKSSPTPTMKELPVSEIKSSPTPTMQELPVSEIKSSPTPTMEELPVSEVKSSPTPTMEELPVSEVKSSPTPTMEELPVSQVKSSPTPTMEELPVSEIKSSPTPTMEELPVSESHDEPSKLSSASSDKGVASRTESRIGESKSPDHSINDDSNDFEENETILRAREEEMRNDSRTPDNSTTLSVPPTSSPDRASQKSPLGSVKGFDNGQPRSLSPMSPTSTDPVSPNSIPKSAGSAGKKKTSPDETEIEQEKEESKTRSATPGGQARNKSAVKVAERAPGTPDDSMKRSTSGRSIKSDAAIESGINHTATPTTNGVALSPTKKLPSKSRETDKRTGSPVKSPSKSVKSLPRTPEAGPPSTAEKKIPMNKVQVGAAPSPNLKTVRSKIGSLDNASYKPGGGKVKIENRKLDFSKAQPKIAAKNDKYTPSGGDKKITQVKLQWNAKPKVGSLDNATYKPGGGDKKIETVKLDFKDKAKPKVGSKDNAKHVPGGGTVKSSSTPPKTPQDPPNDIETQKIDIKAESKIGSLDNVKHKPGGGDKKIFNDKDYLRQTGSNVESLNGSGAQIESPTVAERFIESSPPDPPPSSPSRRSSPISPLTPRALQSPSTVKRVTIAEESIKETGGSKIPDERERPRSSESRKGLRLPELISARSTDNQAVKVESKMKLPKLIETSSLSSRLQL